MRDARLPWVHRWAVASGLMLAFLAGLSGCPADSDDDGDDDDIADDDDGDDDTSQPWSTIDVGSRGSCGLHEGGRAECWGAVDPTLWPLPEERAFSRIAVGTYHVCGLTLDGEVACWGIADGSDLDKGQVTDAPLGTFVALSSHEHTSCALATDGSMECWGKFWEYESTAEQLSQVDLGRSHYCGLRTDDTVFCDGSNAGGQLDAPGGSFEQVSAGIDHSCGLRSDGSVECWGCQSLDTGQCDVPSGHTFVQVEAGGNTFALTDEGEVVWWGGDFFGTDTPPDETFQTISHFSHSCGITTGGQVLCWGCDPEWEDGECDPPGS